MVCLIADSQRLPALQDQVDHRLIDGGELVFGHVALHHRHTRDTGFSPAVFRAHRQAAHFFKDRLHGQILDQLLSAGNKKAGIGKNGAVSDASLLPRLR